MDKEQEHRNAAYVSAPHFTLKANTLALRLKAAKKIMGNYLVNVISVDCETRYCLLHFSLLPLFQEHAALSTQTFPNTAQVCSSSGWWLVTPF